MAQPALAYRQPARRELEQEHPSRQPQPQPRPARPPLRVLPGAPSAHEAQLGLALVWRTLFICGIVAALMIGVVWVARVSLSEATMSLLIESEQVAQSIEAERSKGSRLEVEYAIATNPSAIQEEAATKYGMSPAPQVDYLSIPTEE